MDRETKQAYEWALNQPHHSVAADYARILARHIEMENCTWEHETYEGISNALVEAGYLREEKEINGDAVWEAFMNVLKDLRHYKKSDENRRYAE